MKYVIKAIHKETDESFLLQNEDGITDLYDTELEAGTAMGIFQITDADGIEDYILSVVPEPCARRDRVTPIMGSVYCGCSSCEPLETD